MFVLGTWITTAIWISLQRVLLAIRWFGIQTKNTAARLGLRVKIVRTVPMQTRAVLYVPPVLQAGAVLIVIFVC